MDCNDKYVSYSIFVYVNEQNVSRYLRIMYQSIATDHDSLKLPIDIAIASRK